MEKNCFYLFAFNIVILFNMNNGEATAKLTAAGRPCDKIKRDCLDLYLAGCKRDGVFQIDPKQNGNPIRAFCDMTYNGGGWTVIQRRIDDTVDFFRDFGEYARGFGDLDENMWWGLDNIHKLTNLNDESSELYIELESFENEYKYAKYSNFYINDSKDLFKLHVSGYYGTAGDSLTYSNGAFFTTYDLDADTRSGNNCARIYYGAWWHKSCSNSDLNGLYLSGSHTRTYQGVLWNNWKGNRYSYKTAVMKVRRQSRLVAPSMLL